jgi:hypothetical protein
VWAVYGARLGGVARRAVGAWFVLIGVSTLLVYQHHVIDVLGGYLVAVLCLYVFPAPATRFAVAGSRTGDGKLGAVYAALALGFVALAWACWPWGFVMLWPAVAMLVLAGAYWRLGPGVFRKSGGQLPWSARLVLGPYLVGAALSACCYRRRLRLYDEVVPGILLGCRLTEREARAAVRAGVGAVLDLTAEYPEADCFLALPYRNVQILDLTAPTVGQFRRAVGFLRRHAPAGKVYVHCALGRSRGAAVVAAYCLATGAAATPAEAVALVQRARPQAAVGGELLAALGAYQEALLRATETVKMP